MSKISEKRAKIAEEIGKKPLSLKKHINKNNR
jgi:hypothetical protein